MSQKVVYHCDVCEKQIDNSESVERISVVYTKDPSYKRLAFSFDTGIPLSGTPKDVCSKVCLLRFIAKFVNGEV